MLSHRSLSFFGPEPPLKAGRQCAVSKLQIVTLWRCSPGQLHAPRCTGGVQSEHHVFLQLPLSISVLSDLRPSLQVVTVALVVSQKGKEPLFRQRSHGGYDLSQLHVKSTAQCSVCLSSMHTCAKHQGLPGACYGSVPESLEYDTLQPSMTR